MRKKLDTRFPAPRIKKIMQADEDVGKIALAVPVLVSKALELFLQDLCDRTYNITVQRGVKTVSSSHLKQCIHNYNVYDFLRDVVSKVPDIGTSDACGDDKHGKRRKAAEEYDSEEESKRTRNEAAVHTSSRGRGRGRGRGRRGGRGAEREITATYEKFENDHDISHQNSSSSHLKVEVPNEGSVAIEMEATPLSNTNASLRNIDLNLELDENKDEAAAPAPVLPPAPTTGMAAASAATSTPELNKEAKPEDFLLFPGWQMPEMNKMAVDPVQFALTNHRLEDDEDYDNEG